MVTFKRENRPVFSAAVIPGLFMTMAVGVLFLSAPAQAQQPAKKAPAAAPAKKAAAAKKTTSSAWVKLCEEQKTKTRIRKKRSGLFA